MKKKRRVKKKQGVLTSRLTYIMSLLICSVFVFFVGGRISYGLFVVFALVLPVSAVYALVIYTQFNVRHSLDTLSCVRGSKALYSVGFKNKSMLFIPWCRLTVTATRGLLHGGEERRTSLMPFSGQVWRLEMVPRHRGLYNISIENAKASDLFGLFLVNKARLKPDTLLALPKLYEISQEWRQKIDQVFLGGLLSQNPDEPAVDAREYQYGDSLRRIHWNLTARKQELMVRQFECENEQRLAFVLDLTPIILPDALDCEDIIIEACLSLMNYSIMRRIPVTLIYAEGSEITRYDEHDEEGFNRMYRKLAAVPFDSSVEPERLIDAARDAAMTLFFTARDIDSGFISSLPREKPCGLYLIAREEDTEMESNGNISVTYLRTNNIPDN